MVGEEKRHQMMQNLFGEQSEEEEDEEVESEHESNRQPEYLSDEAEGEGEVKAEEQGEAEVESEGDLHDVDPDPGESEGERVQSSPEREVSDQNAGIEEKDAESDEQEEYGHIAATRGRQSAAESESEGSEDVHVAARRRRQSVAESESERSEDNYYVGNGDEEVDQARKSRSPSKERDQTHVSHSAAEIRDVFGDSDEEGPAEYANQNDIEQESHRSYMEEEESYEKNVRPEDIVPDDDAQSESEENIEAKLREKPVGPPIELEIPLRNAPGQSDKMNMIKVSNIMGVEPKPFDPKTYVEEDMFVTDESGAKKRIRLENNIVRWRQVVNPDGSLAVNRDGTPRTESNARFVRWSDGSLQLLIGNEVLDISVQEAEHDQAHLFLRHAKGILQSQGRLLRKMRFMPSSLTSNSHRLLTALVDSRHKKVYKVKNCFTDTDPEREKEEREKAAGQNIRSIQHLNKKKEKVNRKYTPKVDRGRQLSPGFLEEALDEDEEPEYHESRRSAHRRYEEDLELEAQAEKRIINAKKAQKDTPRKSFLSAGRSRRAVEEYSESEREESEYETDGDEVERLSPRKRVEESEHEEEEYDGPDTDEAGGENEASEEEEEPRSRKGIDTGTKRKDVESDVDSPPRKAAHRKKVVFESDSD